MKIIDCCMFFNEDLILDLRLNELDKYVDFFVIVESAFTHSGEYKNLNFDIKKYEKFKNKIIYLKILNKPENLFKIKKSDTINQVKEKQIINALILENFQRNYISEGLKNFNDDDYILISDVDEIPNLNRVNFDKLKNKISLFKQYFFHYKFNLYLKDFFFFGSRGCFKKNLISPQWLRNIKSKKYSFFRLDTIFSKKKYQNIEIIDEGGWHFTNIMNEDLLVYKLKSYLHHADFPEELLDKNIFSKLIKEKKIMYDHSVDKSGKKFDNKKILSEFEKDLLPNYIKENFAKYKNWII